MKFTKETLDNIIKDIVEEQFAEEPHNSFEEMIDYVLGKHSREIESLEKKAENHSRFTNWDKYKGDRSICKIVGCSQEEISICCQT